MFQPSFWLLIFLKTYKFHFLFFTQVANDYSSGSSQYLPEAAANDYSSGSSQHLPEAAAKIHAHSRIHSFVWPKQIWLRNCCVWILWIN
jgi:hypothetical protein